MAGGMCVNCGLSEKGGGGPQVGVRFEKLRGS